jgi:cellulose synthase/poly-beta-1,6-N-acetylglucosamine synthase-like glycosyltransferase
VQTADGGSRDNDRDREAPAVRRPADAVDPLAVSLALAAVHLGAPMAYHVETKRWLKRPWDVKRGLQHTPTVTVVIPTYNEARHIEEKLEDVYRQVYPRDRLEIIVVDSASTDGTAEKARRWGAAHPDADVKVVEEPQRRGKNAAEALAMGVLVVVTPEVAENLAAEQKPLRDGLVVAVRAAVPAWRDAIQKYLDLYRP